MLAVAETMAARDHAAEVAYVIARLEEAGRALMALPTSGYSLHARCSMPDVVRNFWDNYGASPALLRAPRPDARSIDEMDEALSWIGFIPVERYVLRRIVGGRLLVHPITDRHVFPFRRLADAIGANHMAVQRWHAEAIDLIVAELHRRGFNFPP